MAIGNDDEHADGMSVLLDLAAIVTQIANRLGALKLSEEGEKTIEEIGKILEEFRGSLIALDQVIVDFRATIPELKAAIEELGFTPEEIQATLDKVKGLGFTPEGIQNTLDKVKEVLGPTTLLFQAIDKVDIDRLVTVVAAFESLGKPGPSASSAQDMGEAVGIFEDATAKFDEAVTAFAALAPAGADGASFGSGGFGGRGGETTGFFPGLGSSRGAVFGFAGAGRPAFLADLDEAIERTNSGVRESMVLETELGKLTEQVFSQMEGVLERFASTGEFEWQRFADAGRAALRDILAGIQEVLGIPSVGQSLGTILGSLFGDFAVGGAGTKLLHVMGKQFGGPVEAGVVTLVGEGGQELFVPRVPGDIISNENLRKMGQGGPTIIYNIDARGADVGVERRIMRALRASEERGARRGMAMTADRNARGALNFT